MAGYIGKSQGVTQVDGYNRTEADGRYVNASGDTMTGQLTVQDTSGISLRQTGGETNQGRIYHDGTNMNIRQTVSGGGLLFYTGASGSGFYRFHRAADNGTTLDINASGFVTMPYQPAAAYTGYTSTSATQVLPATNVFLNRGGHLNAGNTFTCPVAGVYRVTITAHTDYSANYNWIGVTKNGSNVGGELLHWNKGGSQASHDHVAINTLVECYTNDYLEAKLVNANGAAQDTLDRHYVTFEFIG